MEQTTDSEENLEVDNSESVLFKVDRLSASLIIAVALDIHHSFEALINKPHVDKDTISKTVDVELRSGEWSRCCGWNRNWN